MKDDVIGILQDEVKLLRGKVHGLSNSVSGIDLAISRIESKKVCDLHSGQTDKLDLIHTNVEVIKNKIENFDTRIKDYIDGMSKHIAESNVHQEKIIQHDEALKGIKGTKALAVTTLITLVIATIGIAITWGEMRKQIEINSKRLDRLENTIYIK